MKKEQRVLLGGFTLVAFVLRLAYALHKMDPWALGGDAEAYFHMGRQLLGQEPGLMYTHPPLYPAYLALTYCWPHQHLAFALFLQCLLSACCVPLAYALTRLFIPTGRSGLWAAAWVTVDPFEIYFAGKFLSETLFTALLLLGLWRLISAMRQEQPLQIGVAAFFLSLATLTRSILGPFLILFLFWIIAFSRHSWRAKLMLVLPYLIGTFLPILAWSLVLHHKTDHWMMVSTQKGWNSYEGLNERFEDSAATLQYQTEMGQDCVAHGYVDPVPCDAYCWVKYKAFAHDHPDRLARLMVRKFFKFWRIWPYDPYTRFQRIMSGIYMAPLLIMAFLGLRSRVTAVVLPATSADFLLMAFVLCYSLLNTITWTQIRYRIPLHPLLALWAGIGVATTFSRRLDDAREQ